MCSAIRGNLARRLKKHTNEKLTYCKNPDNAGRLPQNEGTHVINDAEQRIIKRCSVNQYSHSVPRLKSKTFLFCLLISV